MLADGPLSSEEFRHSAAHIVSAANLQASMTVDRFMSDRLGVAPSGIGRPDSDVARLADAFQTIMQGDGDILSAITRLAETEPLNSGQSGSRAVLLAHDVKRYRWQTAGNSCRLCKWLALKTWPTSKAAIVHP